MKAILVTTTNYRHCRSPALQRMLASVAAAEDSLKGQVRLFLLLQACTAKQYDEFSATCPSFVQAFRSEEQISLSAARNLLLRQVFADADSISPQTMIAFPDDDCWYPVGALEGIAAAFEREQTLDFLFCRYSSSPEPLADHVSIRRAPGAICVVRNASSNTMFVRGPMMAAFGFYDEALGVGTSNASGEDVDFSLSAFLNARQSGYLDGALIGHRDKNNVYRHRYYRGGLVVLGRYSLSSAALFYEFCRKIGIGVYLTATGKLALNTFFAALAIALLQLGTKRAAIRLSGATTPPRI